MQLRDKRDSQARVQHIQVYLYMYLYFAQSELKPWMRSRELEREREREREREICKAVGVTGVGSVLGERALPGYL